MHPLVLFLEKLNLFGIFIFFSFLHLLAKLMQIWGDREGDCSNKMPIPDTALCPNQRHLHLRQA